MTMITTNVIHIMPSYSVVLSPSFLLTVVFLEGVCLSFHMSRSNYQRLTI
jgi:hypothetical protein